MRIRFKAEIYQQAGQTVVDVFDHQTGLTTTITLDEFNTKRSWYAHNGAMITGHRNQKADAS